MRCFIQSMRLESLAFARMESKPAKINVYNGGNETDKTRKGEE